MKTISVAKADGSFRSDSVESITLQIGDEIPPKFEHTPTWETQYTEYYDAQATKVVEALLALPGGTLDRVFVKLLARSVSLHRVPWEKAK